jgi:hypothetical protein
VTPVIEVDNEAKLPPAELESILRVSFSVTGAGSATWL